MQFVNLFLCWGLGGQVGLPGTQGGNQDSEVTRRSGLAAGSTLLAERPCTGDSVPWTRHQYVVPGF